MNEPQTGKQVARPAEEEIKKHGDQLQKQVDDAAGRSPQKGQNGQAGQPRQPDPGSATR